MTQLILKQELAPAIYRFRFRPEPGVFVQFTAGQYMILMVPQTDGQYARRLYSILTPPSQKKYFDIVVEIIPHGVASNYLMQIKEHDQIFFQGPAGVFTLKKTQKPKVFLATGTGIVPMMSILDTQFTENPDHDTTLFWGLPYYKELYLFDELKNMSLKHSHFHLKICLSREKDLSMIPEEDRKYFSIGRITQAVDLQATYEDIIHNDYYVCGGREVVESLRQYLYTKHIAKEAVHFEKF